MHKKKKIDRTKKNGIIAKVETKEITKETTESGRKSNETDEEENFNSCTCNGNGTCYNSLRKQRKF